MFATARDIDDESFYVPALAVDDHKEEMASFTREMKKWNVRPKLFETATDWARLARKADDDTILISDNLLPGVNDLGSLGFPDVDTSRGEEAGLRLLTTYCDRSQIDAGLKILLTQFPLRKEAKQYVNHRNRNENNKIYVFMKNKPEDVRELDNVVRKFSRDRRTRFIRDKVEYIRDAGRDWHFSELEVANLFSVQDEDDAVWVAATSGTTSLDIERRCDLIYRIKLNLATVYGGGDLAQEAAWWRTKLPILGNKTPFEYVSSHGIERLYSLVSVMEGNH
jgi:hypothetical protein